MKANWFSRHWQCIFFYFFFKSEIIQSVTSKSQHRRCWYADVFAVVSCLFFKIHMKPWCISVPTCSNTKLIYNGNEENHFIVCVVSDCIHLSTARWLCASRMTTSATQSATLAQIAVLTSWWEVTFGPGMWCTVRSTPKRSTKVKVLPLNPPCPIANESAAPHFPGSGRRVLLVCLKLHLISLSYRLWDGARRWTLVDHMTQDVLH